jgi:DNA modification methylase
VSSPAFRPNEDLPEETQRKLGGYMANGAVIDRAEGGSTGTSIFDPVLCELAYRWFCPPDGLILDPFAGGSVRGIVAAMLGRRYIGIDLRPEQVEANRAQAQQITPDNLPVWIVGDSRNLSELISQPLDFIFSCPPYYDFEVYSDDPQDLSTVATYREFIELYRAIIAQAVGLLKPDRFACFVVGDIRDKKGFYCNFVSDTTNAFQDAGAMLYNEAVLITAVGSLPIRVGKQFEAGRKLGKTHQNVLVFCKGDPRKATEAIGPVEVWLPETEAESGEYGEELVL